MNYPQRQILLPEKVGPKRIRIPYSIQEQMKKDRIPTDPCLVLAGAFKKHGLTPVLETRFDSFYVDVTTKEIPFLLNQVDGSSHEEEEIMKKDIRQEKFSAFKGFITVRWYNEQVFYYPDSIVYWNIGFYEYCKQFNIDISQPNLDVVNRCFHLDNNHPSILN